MSDNSTATPPQERRHRRLVLPRNVPPLASCACANNNRPLLRLAVLVASTTKLDASCLAPLQHAQLPPPRPPWLKNARGAGTAPDAEAKMSSDLASKKEPKARHIHRTRPPGPHDGARHYCPSNNASHEIGRRTIFRSTGGNVRPCDPL